MNRDDCKDTHEVRRRFQLLDLGALVVGYALAALLVRAFWPSATWETPQVIGVIGIIYAWLGLAMSGPLILTRKRRGDGTDSRTWAELAWLLIGFYWLAMAVLLVPVRMRYTNIVSVGLLGVFPFLAGLALRFFSPRARTDGVTTRRDDERAEPSWTHRAAVGLLVTWPLVWIALILLGKTM